MYIYIKRHNIHTIYMYIYKKRHNIYMYIYKKRDNIHTIYMYIYMHAYYTQVNICIHVHTCMRRLRLVGSLKVYVSFTEYSLFYKALLQQRPIILRSLLIVATPYTYLEYVP